jgi:anaerobic ribonucleoside-triphosphate reductase
MCQGEIEDWQTRIVGYMVPVKQWNKVKQAEFKTRVWNEI